MGVLFGTILVLLMSLTFQQLPHVGLGIGGRRYYLPSVQYPRCVQQ